MRGTLQLKIRIIKRTTKNFIFSITKTVSFKPQIQHTPAFAPNPVSNSRAAYVCKGYTHINIKCVVAVIKKLNPVHWYGASNILKPSITISQTYWSFFTSLPSTSTVRVLIHTMTTKCGCCQTLSKQNFDTSVVAVEFPGWRAEHSEDPVCNWMLTNAIHRARWLCVWLLFFLPQHVDSHVASSTATLQG